MASSSSSATVAVEKSTSDLLISPDWTMNIEICDSINSSLWQAKDVVRAVKKRLQHKNPKVQFLSLTLLETMVKNCGDYVHFQIADRNILEEMIKIIRKKADMQVRDKVLVLLDSWQEAFGGPGGKYPQYYWACEELRRSGVAFPKRSSDAAPIFTPPITNPTLPLQPGYGMPTNASRRLDETMASESESLSLSSLDAMRDVVELLTDMLRAVNPGSSAALKDDVIVELVHRCRTNQKKLVQMLSSTGEEELLGEGLELNDRMQSLLAKHDALASGSPLPVEGANSGIPLTEASSSNPYLTDEKNSTHISPRPTPNAGISSEASAHLDEEDDEFAQLAKRHLKPQPGNNGGTSNESECVSSIPTNAPALPDSAAAPMRTTKEQDMIDLLSMTLSLTTVTHQQTSSENMHQVPVSPNTQGNSFPSQTYFGSQKQVQYDSYVVPWAQSQPQSSQFQYENQQQPHCQSQPSGQQLHPQPQQQAAYVKTRELQLAQAEQQVATPSQTQQGFPPKEQLQQFQHHVQSQGPLQAQELQAEGKPQCQHHQQLEPLQSHKQYPQYPGAYPARRWAATPGFSTNTSTDRATNVTGNTSFPNQSARQLQHYNPLPSRGLTNPAVSSPQGRSGDPTAQKPFVPSYRLFEDLNVFGDADAKNKMTTGSSSSNLSGTMGPGKIGGRK